MPQLVKRLLLEAWVDLSFDSDFARLFVNVIYCGDFKFELQ